MKSALSSRSAPASASFKREKPGRKLVVRPKWLVLVLVNLTIWIALIAGLIQLLT
jgi:hypothetical protein